MEFIEIYIEELKYFLTRSPNFILAMCRLKEIYFFYRQAAELSHGLGGSATQQAVVHAFLKDFDRVS